jgi:hypothetical protein
MPMQLQLRPWVLFDPSNNDHRAYFSAFLKTRSWSNCPVQWVIGDDSKDVVHYISKILLDHYIQAEFNPKNKRVVAKKPQNLLKNTP